jgi:excisionase family DNA binding protein
MDILLSVPETCRRLGCGRTRFYELIRSGRLPSVLLGQSRRVRESDLTAFIASLADQRGGDAA